MLPALTNRLNVSVPISFLLACQPIFCQNPSKADNAEAKRLFQEANNAKAKGYALTQSQAHMSVPKIQERILKTTEALAKNKNLINQTMKKEQEYKKDYYVFYTAIPYMHIFQDVTRKMYKRVVGKPKAIANKQFQFVRYNYKDSTYDKYKNATDFLVKQIQTNGLINDREAEIGTILVSTNLALLGNTGFTGESTWYFFNNAQPWAELNRTFLEASLKTYGYSTKFVDELIRLAQYLKDDQGSLGVDLFQIFVPKKTVDKLGYLSWRLGIPFDKDFIQKLFNRKSMTFGPGDGILYAPGDAKIPGIQYLQPTVTQYIEDWKAGKKNPRNMSKKLVENVKKGNFKLSSFLDKYTKKPEAIPELNWSQGRLLITNDMLLNPNSGIIMFRYDTHDPAKVTRYKQELKKVIEKMEKERKARLGIKQPTIAPKDLGQSLTSLTVSLNQLANLIKKPGARRPRK